MILIKLSAHYVDCKRKISVEERASTFFTRSVFTLGSSFDHQKWSLNWQIKKSFSDVNVCASIRWRLKRQTYTANRMKKKRDLAIKISWVEEESHFLVVIKKISKGENVSTKSTVLYGILESPLFHQILHTHLFLGIVWIRSKNWNLLNGHKLLKDVNVDVLIKHIKKFNFNAFKF